MLSTFYTWPILSFHHFSNTMIKCSLDFFFFNGEMLPGQQPCKMGIIVTQFIQGRKLKSEK